MSDKDAKTITLGSSEIDPRQELEYREKIRAARAGASPINSLKGNTPLGGEKKPQMPLLRQTKDMVSAPQDGGVHPRGPGAPVLRPETQEQLANAIKIGQQLEADAATKKGIDDKKIEEEAKLAALFENFDFGDQRDQVEKILDNKKRRELIESRCQPMDFEDLLMKDEVQQRVPIIADKFEPTFRSITPIESLYIKQRMSKETVNTDQYMGEKYNLLLLTCSLVEINGLPLPDHRRIQSDGNFVVDDKLFEEKFAVVMRKSGYIVADLSVNYLWFDIRVRKLLNPDDLKNG
jgi:hypothetical protein